MKTKTKTKTPQSIQECIKILESPDLKGEIGTNSLTKEIIKKNLPWDFGEEWRAWTEIDDAYLRLYCEQTNGQKNPKKIDDALRIVSRGTEVNPIKEVLARCYENDCETDAIMDLFHDFLGVEKTDYNREVLTLMMLGAISRIYHPGCSFPYTLVISGKQGIGKSQLLKALAMEPEYFEDTLKNVSDKDEISKISGKIIVEFQELRSLKGTALEIVKSFLTTNSDKYRPPYAKRTQVVPRTCIMVATTNSPVFLSDPTGNRRFLPLICDEKGKTKDVFRDSEELEKMVRSAWGEAMWLFFAEGMDQTDTPFLRLSPEAEKELMAVQDEVKEEDPRIGMIQDWLDNTNYDYVCLSQIKAEALPHSDGTRRESNELTTIMAYDIKGWEKCPGKKWIEGYGSQRAYQRIEAEAEELDGLRLVK